MEREHKVTSKDIAKACGVSQTTVSYVINNTAGVNISEKTRRLVLETAKRLHYIPNSAARGMRMKNAGSIGVVIGRNTLNIGFNNVLRGIKSVLDKYGMSITLLHDDQDKLQDAEYMNYYRSGRIDGIIFCFCEMEDEEKQMIEERGIPYIMADESGVWGGGLPGQDMLQAAIAQSVEFCVGKGWNIINFFSFKYGENLFSHKYDIFKATVLRLLPEAELRRIVIQIKGREREDIQQEILSIIRSSSCDLAITPHQRLGLYVQSAIMKNRMQIPQYPKHICLDTSHMLGTIYPSVTSLDIPLVAIGEESCRALLTLIRGEKPGPAEFKIAVKPGTSTE